ANLRPFKALVPGSSPGRPTLFFCLVYSFFIGKTEHFRRELVRERKRRDASENEVYLTTIDNESRSPQPPWRASVAKSFRAAGKRNRSCDTILRARFAGFASYGFC